MVDSSIFCFVNAAGSATDFDDEDKNNIDDDDFGDIGGMMFSGGVAEYVYDREQNDFGDMGRRLGHAIRRKIDAGKFPWPLLPAHECIRATALGASEYSVQLSGNTSYISTPGALLPRLKSGDTAGLDVSTAALLQRLRS